MFVPDMSNYRVAQAIHCFIEKFLLEELNVFRPSDGVARLDGQDAEILALLWRNHL